MKEMEIECTGCEEVLAVSFNSKVIDGDWWCKHCAPVIRGK